MSGWLAGRPLTAKIRRTASGFSASAPNPYTVSVGKATSPPRSSTSTRVLYWLSGRQAILRAVPLRAATLRTGHVRTPSVTTTSTRLDGPSGPPSELPLR